MTDRTEHTIRLWLASEAHELRTPAELRERVAAISQTAAPRDLPLSAMRRPVVMAFAAGLILALILVAALFVASRRQDVPPALGRLAYALNGAIYVANADGSHPRRITDGVADPGGLGFRELRWHANILTFRGDVSEYIVDGTRVSVVGRGTGWGVSIDPKGTRLATLADSEVRVDSRGSSALVHLAPPAGYDVWDISDIASFVWMDDDTLLVGACRVSGERCMKSAVGHDLFSVPVDGGPVQNITGGGEPAFSAMTSPGGSQIAFLYLPPADRWHWERAELWLMDRDGAHRRRLPTPNGPMAFAWSRDGRSIAFTLRTNDTTTISAHDLWVVDVASGSPARALSVGQFASDGVSAISWSADGGQLLVAGTDAAGQSGLWSFDVDTGSPHLLVPGATDGAWR